MNKRPGHVTVTTEVGFCTFCGRPRNLRHEQHQLGTLVRTIVTCESCHRTLSSTIGVAAAVPEREPVAADTEPAAAESSVKTVAEKQVTKPAAARKPARAAAAKTTTAKRKAQNKSK